MTQGLLERWISVYNASGFPDVEILWFGHIAEREDLEVLSGSVPCDSLLLPHLGPPAVS